MPDGRRRKGRRKTPESALMRGVLWENAQFRDQRPNYRGQATVVCPSCGGVTYYWMGSYVRYKKTCGEYQQLRFKVKPEQGHPDPSTDMVGGDATLPDAPPGTAGAGGDPDPGPQRPY